MFSDKKFSEKITIKETGCWEYQGSISYKGYGKVHKRKLFKWPIGAHRYSWFLTHGNLPDLCVCHKCDNRKCVNPEHLFLGTHKDNSDDKIKKGRDRRANQSGENNGNSVLTESMVKEIKEMIARGMYNTHIAKFFGVTHSQISLIRLGKCWQHVKI